MNPQQQQAALHRPNQSIEISNAIRHHVRPMFNTLTRVLTSVPQNAYIGSIQLANFIAEKLEEIGDAYSGKGDNDNDFVQLPKKHYDYLENVRKTNKTKYKELVMLANAFKGMQATPEKQKQLLTTYKW